MAKITIQEATARLAKRYSEQVEKYPLMRHDVPLELYIKRNPPHVLSSELENPLFEYSDSLAVEGCEWNWCPTPQHCKRGCQCPIEA